MSRLVSPGPGPGGGGQAFICEKCGRTVPGEAPGSMHRNHCPECLWSLHVDLKPGDRRSCCRGLMEPIAVFVRQDGEWSLLHRCRRCSFIRANRIGGDDSVGALMSIALRPLALPPVPWAEIGPLLGRLGTADGREAGHD